MELINTHCHTGFCGHGEGEVGEYVTAAKEAGLSLLAFTDHFPLSESFDPDAYLSVAPSALAGYVDAVKQAQEANNAPLEILLGIEMDYLETLEDRTFSADTFSPFDVILGSVHFVDGWAFDDPSARDKWEKEGAPDAIWNRYVDLWCQAASDTTLPFDIMAHPDLPKKFGYYPTFSLQPLYERMAEAANAGNRMIEVNTSGMYYACKEAFPAPALLNAFARAGVPCTVGTDAHTPQNVSRSITDAYKLMKESGYSELTVPTYAHDRRTIPLDF